MRITLYDSPTTAWSFRVVELGDISDWVYGQTYEATQAIGNGMYAYGNPYVESPDFGPINKQSSFTSSSVSFYTTKAIGASSNITLTRYAVGADYSGYITFYAQTYPAPTFTPSFNVSYGDYYSYISNAWLAIATINGETKIGFLAKGLGPRAGTGGCFLTEDTWSAKFLQEIHLVDDHNPYYEGGYSGSGGGEAQKQNWAGSSDSVKEDLMPDESHYGAQACGLVTIFSPSDSQLRYLADVIWGNGFFQFMQNLVENISDLFIMFGMVPFTIDTGQTVEVTWFDFAISGQQVGTGIYLTKAASQFVEIDMGSISLDGTDDRIFATDSVLDYSPYSRLGIYLPFIGYQELDIDECRDNVMNLKYRIDILSGTCVALISLSGRTIYQFTGNCLTQLPLTSMDAQTVISNAVNIGIAAAAAGATGAVASAGDAVTAENLANENITAAGAELQNAQRAASVSNAGGSLAGATANGMMGMKPNFKKSGAIGASASLLSVMQPYLFLTTPRQSMPENYHKVCGFPCNVGGNLGDFSGFTVVEDIRLNGLVATSPEVEEIYQLLKSGVII